ncbi:hypothetical protein Pmani_035109, partial [Petrolisthes manimaculis]
VCLLPKVNSRCHGTIIRYYFDADRRRCYDFAHGGCRTNRNNFATYDECIQACENNPEVIRELDERSIYSPVIAPGHRAPVAQVGEGAGGVLGIPSENLVERRNCRVSPWSSWSHCSATCGKAYKSKTRTIMSLPQFGGRKCPRKLERKRKCKRNPRCARHE